MTSTVILSDNGVSSGSAGLKETGGNDGTLLLQTTTSSGTATTAVTIDNNQNIGLGVTPSAWGGGYKGFQNGLAGLMGSASVAGSYGTTNAYFNGSAWTYITTSHAKLFQADAGGFSWQTAPSGTAGNAISFTQAMTLDASGNLLVGTTATAAAFKARFLWSTAAGSNGLMLEDSSNSSGTAFLYFTESGTTVGSVSRVGATNAVVYSTTSDYRLKTVIGPVSGYKERINSLEPIEFEWKENGIRTRGFLAHKFQESYAHSVTGEKDAVDSDGNPVYQAMQAGTSEVIADLVALLQEQQAIINQLKARLDAANL